jgi:mediator of RNA polymerase II transcription subunit 4
MRRGRLNAEAPLGLLGETHSVGHRTLIMNSISHLMLINNLAPTVSPKAEAGHNIPGANPYRHDARALQSQFFDLDLDLNPDL